MAVRIQLRHDTTNNWIDVNPILFQGEIGIETDGHKRAKIGNGIDKWNDLPYFDDDCLHKYYDEDVHGVKTFLNDIKIGSEEEVANLLIYGNNNIKGSSSIDGSVDISGSLDVQGNISGIVTKAIEDKLGNDITEYYQRKLHNENTFVDDDIDWNSIVDEGVYNVNIISWDVNDSLHQPSQFDMQLSSEGFLVNHVLNDNGFIQIYYPTNKYHELTIMSVVYRTCYKDVTSGDIVWSNWITYSKEDKSIVHTTEDELIKGIKTFDDNTVFNKNVELKEDLIIESNIKFNSEEVTLQSNEDIFIKKDENGIFLSGVTCIRPNGIDDSTDQILFNTEGVIDGKCTKDGEGNVISSTYIKKDDLNSNSIISDILKEKSYVTIAEDRDNYEKIVNKKYSTFDKSKFEIVGSPIITENGVASSFIDSYLNIPMFDLSSNNFEIDLKFTYAKTGGLQNLFRCATNGYGGSFGFLVVATGTDTITLSGSSPDVDGQPILEDGKSYDLKLIVSNDSATLLLNNEVYLKANWQKVIQTGYISIAYPAGGADNKSYCMSSIDLKHFSIMVDDKEVFCGRETGIDYLKNPDYCIIETEEQVLYKYSCEITDPETSEITTYEIYADSDSTPTILYNNDKTIYIGEEFKIVTETIEEVDTVSIKYNDTPCVLVPDSTLIIPNEVKITEDGIISNFSNTNYIKKEITIPENYEIIIPVKLINDNIPQGIARFDDSNGNPIIEITCEDSIIITGYGSEGATSKLTITDLDTTQQMYLRLVKEDSSFIVKYSYDFEEWFEEELEKEYDLNQIHFISIGSIGRRLNPMYGEIDMNLVNIYVNDTLYLFPSLNIPFTYTEDGTKIVDCKYFYYTSNAIDAYNTANYFILDEKRQQFKLPYDSIYGHNRTLKHWRKGAESYEYDTNLECIQTGQATNGTAVVLKKPYADDNYYVSVACSSKDRFGFTPSEDSIYYTKGRIYLE